jgi:hypothetical protein
MASNGRGRYRMRVCSQYQGTRHWLGWAGCPTEWLLRRGILIEWHIAGGAEMGIRNRARIRGVVEWSLHGLRAAECRKTE